MHGQSYVVVHSNRRNGGATQYLPDSKGTYWEWLMTCHVHAALAQVLPSIPAAAMLTRIVLRQLNSHQGPLYLNMVIKYLFTSTIMFSLIRYAYISPHKDKQALLSFALHADSPAHLAGFQLPQMPSW